MINRSSETSTRELKPLQVRILPQKTQTQMNIPTHLLLQAIAGLQHPAIGYEQSKIVVVKYSYHERVTLRFEWLDDVNGWALVEIQEETRYVDKNNNCTLCGRPVGNTVFTVCDGCWDKKEQE